MENKQKDLLLHLALDKIYEEGSYAFIDQLGKHCVADPMDDRILWKDTNDKHIPNSSVAIAFLAPDGYDAYCTLLGPEHAHYYPGLSPEQVVDAFIEDMTERKEFDGIVRNRTIYTTVSVIALYAGIADNGDMVYGRRVHKFFETPIHPTAPDCWELEHDWDRLTSSVTICRNCGVRMVHYSGGGASYTVEASTPESRLRTRKVEQLLEDAALHCPPLPKGAGSVDELYRLFDAAARASRGLPEGTEARLAFDLISLAVDFVAANRY